MHEFTGNKSLCELSIVSQLRQTGQGEGTNRQDTPTMFQAPMALNIPFCSHPAQEGGSCTWYTNQDIHPLFLTSPSRTTHTSEPQPV